MEESKNRIVTSKPPIGRKPSLGLNATDELRNKLPPKVPMTTKTASASSLKAMLGKDDIIGTGNIENYILGSQIGQGAYAIVRSAIQKGSNRKVAMKTYEKSKLLDPHRKRCVKREIDVLEILDHPTIVKLFEVIDAGKQLHLSMEYIGGCSLHSYLKRRPNRKLEESEVRRIFKQILQGIDYSHKKNVTHRDIKLENILLDESNNVKIIDFGFATCFSHEKKVKLFCGTPSYMAPEIVNRIEYSGPPADVWALGVLLYVMLCGTYPFRAQVDKELYKKIQFGQFTVPSSISQGARSLISRILRLNPDKRPSVADILKDAWVLSNENNLSCEPVVEKLPKSSSTGDPFDAEIIFSLKKFGYTEEELKIDLQNERSRASLLYRHLKRSKAESSTGGSITNNNNMSAGFG
jgi:serine/threonine protein kinase